jgi:hypothetical protein
VHHGLGGDRTGIALACGAAVTVVLTVLFVLYQRWRFATLRLAVRPGMAPGPRR